MTADSALRSRRRRETSRGVFGKAFRVLISLLVILALLVGAYWAGRAALVSPEDPLAGIIEPQEYVVEIGSVGRSQVVGASAEWQLEPLPATAVTGTVTEISITGAPVENGDILFKVDERPVVVAEGLVPSYRDLRRSTSGRDVAQLEDLLDALGFDVGVQDGVFDTALHNAVRSWQQALDLPVDGVVRRTDLVFLSALPASLALAPGISVGTLLGGGEHLISKVPEAPVFEITGNLGQSNIEVGTAGLVSYPGGAWEAVVVSSYLSPEFQAPVYVLAGDDGGPVCAAQCLDYVDLGEESLFSVEMILIPEVEGPVVPVAAIGTDAGNGAYVVGTDGGRIPIEVVSSSTGLAVVEGIAPGTAIVVTFERPDQG
jgi:peptidoglycan hydrolase-like protein with peptidoglycan-binding domain